MKIVFFALRKRRTRVPSNIANAFRRLGHEVKLIRYNRWKQMLGRRAADFLLRMRVHLFGPDLVLVWKSRISVPLLATLSESSKTAVINADWTPEPPEDVCARARLADLFLLSNSGQLEEYRRRGIARPVFWPQAFDPEDHKPIEHASPELAADVAFIGKPGLPHRRELLSRLDRDFELKIWGPGWDGLTDRYRGIQHREVLPEQYAAICRAGRVMIGCDAARGVENCFSNRLWFTLGCRGFLVTNYVPGLEGMFENHRHLVWYESPDECAELIRHYLQHPEERQRIAQAGCELVHNNHTYLHRARELLKLLDELPAKKP